MFAKLAQNYKTDNPLEVPLKMEFGGAAQMNMNSAIIKEDEPDYRTLLVQFYHKHNSAKVNEVEQTLKKYKGKEKEMFAKLAQKYKAQNPLEPATSVTAMASSSVSSTTSTAMASNTATPSTNVFAPAPAASAFGSSASPFGQPTAISGFGNTSSAAPAAGGFGAFAAGSSFSSFHAGLSIFHIYHLYSFWVFIFFSFICLQPQPQQHHHLVSPHSHLSSARHQRPHTHHLAQLHRHLVAEQQQQQLRLKGQHFSARHRANCSLHFTKKGTLPKFTKSTKC